MIRKIIYLVNPISGTKRKSSLVNMIRQRTNAAGIAFEIMETDPLGDYTELKKRIEKEHITDIVICGGDGTVSAVAAALRGNAVSIGIIPLGSGNGLALAAKIPASPSRALAIVLDGKSSWIDGFYINQQFSCMLCGIGFDAKVAEDFAKEKRRGLQTYIKISLINLFRARPYSFEVETAAGKFSTEAFFISIANSNQFGNQFTIAPQASLSDGLLDIVIVTKMNKLLLPFSVIAQVTGINGRQELSDYIQRKNIIYFQTDSFTLLNTDEAPFHIDGDPKETSKRFEISIVRKAIRLIQP